MSDNYRSVVKRENRAEQVSQQRTNHLLVIGIDKYKNGIATLNNAVRDAKTFRDILLNTYQFEEKNITSLFDEAATIGNIRKTFSNILNSLTDADNLIFYYSGHGEERPSGKSVRGYWIPHDAILDEDYTYLPNEEINLLFKNSRAHHVFGIVDSCYSGNLFTRSVDTANERINSFASRWLLTAGRNELVSDGVKGGNSPFADTLFSYLKTYPNDSFWVSDLCTRVLKGMDYTSEKQTPRGEPLQDAAHRGGQFVFYKKGFIPEPEKVVFEAPTKVVDKVNKGLGEQKEVTIPKLATPTNLKSLKTYLKKLTNLNLEEALIQFEKYLSDGSSKENDILMQQGSFNRNKNQQLSNLITEANASRTEARIRYAMLSYIDDLEEEDVQFDA